VGELVANLSKVSILQKLGGGKKNAVGLTQTAVQVKGDVAATHNQAE